MYFREHLVILSPLKRAGTFILTNLNVILPKMIWAKLGRWKCEEIEIVFPETSYLEINR